MGHSEAFFLASVEFQLTSPCPAPPHKDGVGDRGELARDWPPEGVRSLSLAPGRCPELCAAVSVAAFTLTWSREALLGQYAGAREPVILQDPALLQH